jgi:hypothetical protein
MQVKTSRTIQLIQTVYVDEAGAEVQHELYTLEGAKYCTISIQRIDPKSKEK